jgi:hypothetical protein
MWSADHLLDAAAPHHYRTRSSGEQRGVTVKADGTCESPCQPSMQVSTPIQARMTAPSQAESAQRLPHPKLTPQAPCQRTQDWLERRHNSLKPRKRAIIYHMITTSNFGKSPRSGRVHA